MIRMGVFLYYPSTAVTNQMFQQGLLPNQGLGKEDKGRIGPIILGNRPPRARLGYF